MVLRANRATARLLGIGRFCLLAFVALLIAHDSVHLAQHQLDHVLGIGPGMPRMEHDGHWPLMAMAGSAAGVLLFAWALTQYGRLNRLVRDCVTTRRQGRRHAYPSELKRLWTALYPAVVVAYGILENIEHVAADGQIEGLATLVGSEHILALPVLAVVTAALAALGALVRWRIAILEAQLAAAGRPEPRRRLVTERPMSLWWIVAATCARVWIVARNNAGRAPPPRVST